MGCVKNCSYKDTRRHRFPNPKRELPRMLLWISIFRLNIHPQTVYDNNRICPSHFTEDSFSPGTKRLKHNAVPNLFLPGFQQIWKFLNDNGIGVLLTRHLNQDPLENFFGAIRSHGARNINPSCTAFSNAYKTLLINNLVYAHSSGSNCEDDSSGGCISILQHFLSSSTTNQRRIEDERTSTIFEPDVFEMNTLNEPREIGANISTQVVSYVAGFILKKVWPIMNDCQQCKDNLIATSVLTHHDIIVAREYDTKKRLRYPSNNLLYCVQSMKEMVYNSLERICHESAIKHKLTTAILRNCNFTFSNCDVHGKAVVDKLISYCIHLFIYYWCKTISNILHGKCRISPGTTDKIKLNALERYNKYVRYKRK